MFCQPLSVCVRGKKNIWLRLERVKRTGESQIVVFRNYGDTQ